MPRWLAAWLAVSGLLLGATIGLLVYAVVDLHAHNIATDRRICASERTDRAIDAAVVAAARLPVTVPPLTREECPLGKMGE